MYIIRYQWLPKTIAPCGIQTPFCSTSESVQESHHAKVLETYVYDVGQGTVGESKSRHGPPAKTLKHERLDLREGTVVVERGSYDSRVETRLLR